MAVGSLCQRDCRAFRGQVHAGILEDPKQCEAIGVRSSQKGHLPRPARHIRLGENEKVKGLPAAAPGSALQGFAGRHPTGEVHILVQKVLQQMHVVAPRGRLHHHISNISSDINSTHDQKAHHICVLLCGGSQQRLSTRKGSQVGLAAHQVFDNIQVPVCGSFDESLPAAPGCKV